MQTGEENDRQKVDYTIDFEKQIVCLEGKGIAHINDNEITAYLFLDVNISTLKELVEKITLDEMTPKFLKEKQINDNDKWRLTEKGKQLVEQIEAEQKREPRFTTDEGYV